MNSAPSPCFKFSPRGSLPCRAIRLLRSITLGLVWVAVGSTGSSRLSAETVSETVAAAGLSGGIAVFIDPSPALMEEAIVLASREFWVVQLMVTGQGKAETLRSRLADNPLLGRQLYVTPWQGEKLPHADHFIDFLKSEVPVPRDEVLRVLSPIRGRGIVDGETIRKPAIPGSDNWTHRLRGPDNNPVSRDTAFRLPSMLQYLGSPMQTSFQGSMLVEDGVRYEFTDWVLKKPDRSGVAGKLLARNLYNGLIVWVQDLPQGIEPDEPICAVQDGIIHLASGSAAEVLRIDGATGRELEPIRVDSDPEMRVRWLAIDDGRVLTLTGQKKPTRAPFTFILRGDNRKARAARVAAGRTISCFDIETGQRLWEYRDESQMIDYRAVAAHSGRTFYYSENSHLRCLGPDGSVVWTNDDPTWLAKAKRPDRIRNVNTQALPAITVDGSGILTLNLRESQQLFVFDHRSGEYLNAIKTGAFPGNKTMILDGKVMINGRILEPSTGEMIGQTDVDGYGCGVITWVPGLDGALSNTSFGAKSSCAIGAYASGGVVNLSSSQCDCWPHLRGAASMVEAGKVVEQVRESPEHPLVSGPVLAPSAPLPVQPGDWARYRGDPRRLGSMIRDPRSAPKIRWTSPPSNPFPVSDQYDRHTLEWPERPTPPVVASHLTVAAGSDGLVRGIFTATGETQWTYRVDGPVFTAPEIANGRVYVPGGDGWVHCLDWQTGALIWKWRGAPVERTMAIYGKPVSSWPITSLVTDGDAVYGVAGQWMQNGVLAFAINADTGEPRWTHWTDPDHDTFHYLARKNPAYAPSGYLVLLEDKLHVRTALGFPASFNTRTGERIQADPDISLLQKSQRWSIGVRAVTAGADLIGLDRNTLIGGGSVLLLPPSIRQDKSHHRFVAYYIDDNGSTVVEPIARPAIPSSLPAPAIHGRDILLVGGSGRTWRSESPTEGLHLWDVQNWRKAFESSQADEGAFDDDPVDLETRRGKVNRFSELMKAGFATKLDPGLAHWNQPKLEINALALGPGTAVAVVGKLNVPSEKPSYGEHVGFDSWSLQGFDRNTGEQIWSVDLPGEPIFNGLAATAEGAILLTLRDGSVVCVQ